MREKYTLQRIIKIVIVEVEKKKDKDYNKNLDVQFDNKVKNTERAFGRLIERLGSEKEILKHGGKNMEFDQSELPFMKIILSQLYDNTGIIAEFANKRNRNKKFSSKEVHTMIQSLIDEADKSGMNEDELIDLAQFLSSIFLIAPLRSIEYCHMLIDTIASELQDLTSDLQSKYLHKVEYILFKQVEPILYKEMALRLFESVVRTEDLAIDIEMSKELAEDNIGIQSYEGLDSAIRFQYIQRDRQVLEKIQEDDDLRQYIEKKLGKKAEEIFNYAASEQ